MTKNYEHVVWTSADLSKVVFELEDSDWHDHATESMWASPLAASRYRLKNIPFYVYGVSYDDVVVTEAVGGQNVFRSVFESGGHSTYRIFLVGEKSMEGFETAWQSLGQIGCTCERATDYLVAVDVPPETDIYAAYAALEEGVTSGIWDFEEANCGHPLKK